MKEINVTFVTGNSKKAKYLEKLLGLKIKSQKVDLDEIQSLDIYRIVEHKVRQAFEKIKQPVLVEDVALEFEELNGLPGPFIKFFVDNVPFKKICDMVKDDRRAVARCVFGYFDGQKVTLIESKLSGEVSTEPRGENGYGWDKIFVPEGYNITRAEMDEENNYKTYLLSKPIDKVRDFLISIN